MWSVAEHKWITYKVKVKFYPVIHSFITVYKSETTIQSKEITY